MLGNNIETSPSNLLRIDYSIRREERIDVRRSFIVDNISKTKLKTFTPMADKCDSSPCQLMSGEVSP